MEDFIVRFMTQPVLEGLRTVLWLYTVLLNVCTVTLFL